jgi:hypothetical protein
MIAVAVGVLTACSSDTPSPSKVRQPTISCGNLTGTDCREAEVAVLSVARDKKWSIAKVEMGNGTFCALPGHLFDGLVGCDNPPSGAGRRVGHALISLVGTSLQGYVNLYAGGNGLITQFIALATRPPSPSAG